MLEATCRLLIVFLLLNASLNASANTSVNASASEPCLAEPLRIEKSNTAYAVHDPDNVDFQTVGHLSSDGSLKLYFRTRDEKGVRSHYLKGKEKFAEIMRHFNSKVKRISAHWVHGDNLAEFNRLTGSPLKMDPFEAAEKTWTGKNASEFGYTEVKIKYLEGSPGNYTDVEIDFEKPPYDWRKQMETEK